MAPLIIYITGFRQHAGKTVTSLGLISLLSRYIDPRKIGYIKPVGQQLSELADGRMVDKDALVVERFAGIPDLDMNYVSPVRLGSGFTRKFLRDPHPREASGKLRRDILDAVRSLKDKEIVIAEGTGHPGVGGIVGLSNTRVSNLMKAPMVYLSGGGIGKALDMLEVDLTYFTYWNCDLRGIIFNKLIPGKIDTVRSYLTEELLQDRYSSFPHPLQIFGYLPEVTDLDKPSMRIVQKKFDACRVFGNPQDKRWEVPCRRIRVISLSNDKLSLSKHTRDGDLVVLAAASRRRLRRILDYNKSHPPVQLGGLVLTLGDLTEMEEPVRNHIIESGIPAIMVKEDTAATEAKLHSVFQNTKIQIYDQKKHQDVVDLFAHHFNTEKFLKAFGVQV